VAVKKSVTSTAGKKCGPGLIMAHNVIELLPDEFDLHDEMDTECWISAFWFDSAGQENIYIYFYDDRAEFDSSSGLGSPFRVMQFADPEATKKIAEVILEYWNAQPYKAWRESYLQQAGVSNG